MQVQRWAFSFLHGLNSPELSQSCMSHTQILWMSTVHLLLKVKAHREQDQEELAQKRCPSEVISKAGLFIMGKWNLICLLNFRLPHCSNLASSNKCWYWSFWSTILVSWKRPFRPISCPFKKFLSLMILGDFLMNLPFSQKGKRFQFWDRKLTRLFQFSQYFSL